MRRVSAGCGTMGNDGVIPTSTPLGWHGHIKSLEQWQARYKKVKVCEVGLELLRGALSVLWGAGLASVLGCWASWDAFPGLRVFIFALGKWGCIWTQKLSMLQALPVPARKPDQWPSSSWFSLSVEACGWVLSYLLNALPDAVWPGKGRLTLAGPALCHASCLCLDPPSVIFLPYSAPALAYASLEQLGLAHVMGTQESQYSHNLWKYDIKSSFRCLYRKAWAGVCFLLGATDQRWKLQMTRDIAVEKGSEKHED